MDTTQLAGLAALLLWGGYKLWPQIQAKLSSVPAGGDPEAMQALLAAQQLHKYLAMRPGCKRSLEALAQLQLGNFLPPVPAPAVPPVTPVPIPEPAPVQ